MNSIISHEKHWNPSSRKAEEFICHDEIVRTMEFAREHMDDRELIREACS